MSVLPRIIQQHFYQAIFFQLFYIFSSGQLVYRLSKPFQPDTPFQRTAESACCSQFTEFEL